MILPGPGFETVVGRGLIEAVSAELPDYVAYVAPEAYELARPRLAKYPRAVVEAVQLEHEALEQISTASASTVAEAVVGIGGGSALDTAKFVSWRTGLPLWQFPSIASVDAAFTQPAGVRVERRVRYVGTATPQLVAVDLDLVLSAPAALNRAGAADILSCHTGLADWRHASTVPDALPVDEELVSRAENWLNQLEHSADAVGAVTEDGIRFLVTVLRDIGTTCDAVGFSSFEEGSEHYFAYCLEYLTGMHLVHGELVALGIVAMSIAQQNDPDYIVELLERLRLRYRPHDLGLDPEIIARVLGELPRYCAEESFPPSAAHLLTRETRQEILARLTSSDPS
jgi:glycerol dehydrogenase-like iron-containing ADH family enzyme